MVLPTAFIPRFGRAIGIALIQGNISLNVLLAGGSNATP
jgi:hypothetical protein